MNSEKKFKSEGVIIGSNKMLGGIRKTISNYSYCSQNLVIDNKCDHPIYRGMSKKTDEQVYIKVIPKNISSERRLAIDREMRAVKQLKHIHVIKCFETLLISHNYYMITQPYDFTLASRVIHHKLDPTQAFKYFVQLVNGYTYIRENDFLHLNLSPNTVLLRNGVIKISGFQFSRKLFMEEEVKVSNYLDKDGFSPPNFQGRMHISEKFDIWSLGAIFYYLVTKELPYSGQKVNLTRPENVSDLIWKMMNGCLEVDPAIRLSLQQLRLLMFSGSQRSINIGSRTSIQGETKEKLLPQQKEESLVIKNQIYFIYYLERIIDMLRACQNFPFTDKLIYLLQFYIKMRLDCLNQLLVSAKLGSIRQGELQQTRRLNRNYQKHPETSVNLNQGRLKLFNTANYKYSQGLAIYFQAFLREYLGQLFAQLNKPSSSMESLQFQNEYLLLDFLITAFQLNGLVVQHDNDLLIFADKCLLEEIIQAPVVVNQNTWELIRQKISHLRILN